MNIALATRKALIATVFVPMIAMTAVSMEPAAGLSGAQAQQAGRGGPDHGTDTPTYRQLVQRDCSCRITYRTIGGQRIAVKDCYIEMDEQLRYCSKDTAVN